MLILSTALFDQPPVKNVIVNGMILAEDGKKMSKRLRNYPDPAYILDQYGADALRAYLIDSPAVKADPLRFSERGIQEILRKVLIPLWNAHAFLVTYATVDGWTPASARPEASHRLDRWILSNLQTLIRDVNAEMDAYRLYRVIPRLDAFIDDLTNWYIRRSRERFWGNDDDTDKAAGYHTLYEVLVTFSKVLAPVLPFICERIYQNLVKSFDDGAPLSVHLCDYPEPVESRRDERLETEMALARTIVGLGRSLRSKHKIRTRQPLRDVTVVARTEEERALVRDMEDMIRDELNVKSLAFTDREEDLVHMQAKANFRILGKRFGARMKDAAKEIEGFDVAAIRRLEEGGTIDVLGEAIALDDILVQRTEVQGHVTETCDGVTVSLDTTLTPELIAEGNAREIKNRIQIMRKEAGFNVSDRIRVRASAPQALVEALSPFGAYIQRETLATELTYGTPTEGADVSKEWTVGDETVWVGVWRV